ncbi:MAG: sugar transferase, partial [Candidatus Dormibacteraeota bacterium]|nr:sugar transferase [Candidatus Dormibacteraeota bacterium]
MMARGRRIALLQAVLDAAAALVALYISYQLRFTLLPDFPGRFPGTEPPAAERYALAAPVLVLIVVVVFFLLGVYRPRRGKDFIDELLALIWGMVVVAVVTLAGVGLYRVSGRFGTEFQFSRVTAVYWILITGLLIAVARYLLRRFIAGRRARGLGADRALVVGWSPSANELIQRIRMFPSYGYRVIGVLTDRTDLGDWAAGVPVVGRVADLPRILRTRSVAIAFVTLDQPERTLEVIEHCREAGVDVRILPGIIQLMTGPVGADQIDGIPLIEVRQGLELAGTKTAVKRAFDLILTGLGVIIISPVLALIALLVRVSSPGPILIHQLRVGKNGRTFLAHKFRSMREDAEVETGPVWAAPDDPRRTAVGKWLRRLSLDELPQLWNIVRGEMSLVGPRAERPEFVEEFAERLPRYEDRHLVRPGLTGWAQANDLRGQTPIEDRLIYDLYYIENWSLAFDVKI